MATRASPAEHRKHKSAARLACFFCHVSKTQQKSFLFVSMHSSLAWNSGMAGSGRYVFCWFIYFSWHFSLPTHPNAWPGSPALLSMNHYANKKSAAGSMLDVALLRQRLPAPSCAGPGSRRLLLHPHHHPERPLALSAGHSGSAAYLHRWENEHFFFHRLLFKPVGIHARCFATLDQQQTPPQQHCPPVPEKQPISNWSPAVTMETRVKVHQVLVCLHEYQRREVSSLRAV